MAEQSDEWVLVVPSMRLADFRAAWDEWRQRLSTPLNDDDVRIDLGRRVGGGSFGRARVRRSALQSKGIYGAMIGFSDPTIAGRKVTVVASSLDDARAKLEAEHGNGNVFGLHNEADAARPR